MVAKSNGKIQLPPRPFKNPNPSIQFRVEQMFGGLCSCPCFGERSSDADGSDVDPVLLISGMGGSILHSKKKKFGFETRVWVRILLADLEFKKKVWSVYNPTTGHLSLSLSLVYVYLFVYICTYLRLFLCFCIGVRICVDFVEQIGFSLKEKEKQRNIVYVLGW